MCDDNQQEGEDDNETRHDHCTTHFALIISFVFLDEFDSIVFFCGKFEMGEKWDTGHTHPPLFFLSFFGFYRITSAVVVVVVVAAEEDELDVDDDEGEVGESR